MAVKKVRKTVGKANKSKAGKKAKKIAKKKKASRKAKKAAPRKTGPGRVKKKASKKEAPRTKQRVRKKTRTSRPQQFVTIANDMGVTAQIPMGEELQELAMRWRYILSRRQRWRHSARKDMRQQASEALKEIIRKDSTASVFKGANLLEIQVPYGLEQDGWEARVAPWEFLISAAYAELQTDPTKSPPTIVRWLNRNQVPTIPNEPLSVLYVQCSPGALADEYDFTTERQILNRVFDGEVDVRINPTIAELRQHIISTSPNVIHIAGIDNNQAMELLQDADELPENWLPSNRQDGVVFRSDDPNDELGVQPVDAQMLANALNAADGPVYLVIANVYHSASRTCALAVAEGAGLAIGFQDTVSDALAEIVIDEFYRNWRESNDALPAFLSAMDMARTSVSLSGSGIVLWSGRSLLDGATQRAEDTRRKRKNKRETPLEFDPARFKVDVKVRERLNYSHLHNDSGGLFEKLILKKEPEGTLKGVRLKVVLYLGSESHPYDTTLELTRTGSIEVGPLVKIPLTSSTIRTVSEPIRTSLYVEVSVDEHVVFRETHRVTLLPADEWTDTDENRMWLPSFVLPRDPAVERIIDRAQKHLITLADDRSRGFDGYQSIDAGDPDSMFDVDQQVQAIWSAVVHDFGILYINPPPSYSDYGQRLRTPTQILRGGRGTCIDLALLFAACLEYVEIYPVIFLISGHAFAGYWRNEDRYYEFIEGLQDVEDEILQESIGSESSSFWVFPSDNYAEILNEISRGFLNPIETVGITSHGSFWESIDDGVNNLRSRSEFHSLVDIWSARVDGFITPLPIIEEGATFREGSDYD